MMLRALGSTEVEAMKIIDSIALFGTYCICLTNVHRSNRYEKVIKFKQLIFDATRRAISKKLFKPMMINDV